MKPWLHKVEVIVDRLIPYLVVVLAGIIISELFFREFAEEHRLAIDILDYIIISIFVIDLVFKYIRIRNLKKFLKECWLDIIAVFPFFLIFRLVEEAVLLFRVSTEVKEVQAALHTAIEAKKLPVIMEDTAKIVEEVEKTGRISRTRLVLRALRPLQRLPRLLKAIPFYEKPTGKHHLHELEEFDDAKREIKLINKEAQKKIRRNRKKSEKEHPLDIPFPKFL